MIIRRPRRALGFRTVVAWLVSHLPFGFAEEYSRADVQFCPALKSPSPHAIPPPPSASRTPRSLPCPGQSYDVPDGATRANPPRRLVPCRSAKRQSPQI